MTSDSVSSDRSMASEWPAPGTFTRVVAASGARTASPCPPSMSPSPNDLPAMQLRVTPARPCGQVPSL
jgi:hypothetical protein